MGFKKKNWDALQDLRQARGDGWTNFLTGLGAVGLDPAASTFFRKSGRFFEQQLRDLYKDGLIARIINIPASDMTRKGFRVAGDEMGLVNAYLEEKGFIGARIEALQWD